MAIRLKSASDIEKMRIAGRMVREVLTEVSSMCKPGITTEALDNRARDMIEGAQAEGLFKGYPSHRQGVPAFPGYLCLSINEEVVHGFKNPNRVLEDGDIISIDCGIRIDGWCGDSATTVQVGDVTDDKKKVCEVTQAVLDLAIELAMPGRKWSWVATRMEKYALDAGMSVVKHYVGHGIGKNMHEDPQVPNYADAQTKQRDIVLREGLVLAIEPMCNFGGEDTRELEDGWTVVTADGSPSAHFEHTVAITAKGADVLTDGR